VTVDVVVDPVLNVNVAGIVEDDSVDDDDVHVNVDVHVNGWELVGMAGPMGRGAFRKHP
jgi:hypothetical protein